MQRLARAALLITFMAMAAAASPAAEDNRHARSLAATCAACHSMGESTTRTSPLNGLARSDLERAMHDFASGKRPGTVMPQLAKGYTGAQIAAIAAWYAAQPRERP